MAGRPRTRLGLDKAPCGAPTCRSIPNNGWTYCPHHHTKEASRIAGEWRYELANGCEDAINLTLTIPNPGKPLCDLNREERAAIGILATDE